MQGKTISGYTLKHQLGVGGMAEVWLAENAIGKQAAVKLLLPKFCNDEAIIARFQNEAKVMVKLDHPNIRQVYDFGSIDGRPCIVMEYLEGDDLRALMLQGHRFNNDELVKWWNQIADALNYTHAQGIVHRDIKPSNIFLDKKCNIKLLDFGIAKIKESISMTQTGSMMGTLMYMSPEQVRDSKHIGPESDAYSLAVSFVHLLSGKKPYDSDTSSDYDIRKGIVEIPLDLTGVPADWQGFLAQYLKKRPEDRPALRPFEAVPLLEKAETPPPVDDDEGTIVENVKKPDPKPIKTEEKTTETTDKPKSKKGLWIGLGAIAVAAIVAVLLWPRKPIGGTNDYEYVDLGLPSGTLWATCNVGASTPEGYGNYYAWGETSTKGTYNWSTYRYADGDDNRLTKYCNKSDYGNNGFTDNLTTLQSGDDPATSWGSGWRTPTKAQWEELLANTTNEWTTRNGKSGRLFTSKKNGQTLFLPAAGYRGSSILLNAGSYGKYWSSSLDTDYPRSAWSFDFLSDSYYVDDYSRLDDYSRDSGFTVRPVCSSRQN